MLSRFDITSVVRFSRSGAQIIIFFNLSDFWFIFFFKTRLGHYLREGRGEGHVHHTF